MASHPVASARDRPEARDDSHRALVSVVGRFGDASEEELGPGFPVAAEPDVLQKTVVHSITRSASMVSTSCKSVISGMLAPGNRKGTNTPLMHVVYCDNCI
jgi:hypothetical protein